MASGNTGTISANSNMPDTGLTPKFWWNVEGINVDTGKATVRWKLFMAGNTTDYRIYGTIYSSPARNYLNVNGARVFQITSEGNGNNYNDPIPAYANESRHRDVPFNAQKYWDWTGWTKLWGKVEGSFELSYDDNGNASFSVYGVFQCYYGAGSDKRVFINDTITVAHIDRSSKIPLRRNNSWNNYGYIWHKENGRWIKRKAFHKENGQWKKL